MVSNHLYDQGACHGTAATGYNTRYVVFCTTFSSRVWPHAQVLLTGAILAPGKRTVSALLRVLGLDHRSDFQTYHRVLNRCVWSPLQGSRRLLQVLLATFTPRGRLVFGLDDTIKRRRGDSIAAKGIYRDPVRYSQGTFTRIRIPLKAFGACSSGRVALAEDEFSKEWHGKRILSISILEHQPLG